MPQRLIYCFTSILVRFIDCEHLAPNFRNHFYYFLQDEKRLREAIFFANVCAALTVTGRGGIPSLPTQDAVQRTLTEVAT